MERRRVDRGASVTHQSDLSGLPSSAATTGKAQAGFACVQCGYENHADTVGALNSLAKAHALLAGKQPQDTAGLACRVNGTKQEAVSSRNRLSAVV